MILWQVPGVVPEPFLRAGARVPPQRRSNPVQGIRARARPRALAPLGAGVPPELSPCLAPALGPVPGWSPAYPGSPSVPSLWRCHERGPFEPESPHARGHRPALGFSLALGIACAISPVRGGVPSPFPGQGRGNTPPGRQAGPLPSRPVRAGVNQPVCSRTRLGMRPKTAHTPNRAGPKRIPCPKPFIHSESIRNSNPK